MGDPLTIYDVLGAVDSRSQKYGQPFVTRVETARELGFPRIEVDPVFDEAVDEKSLIEDPKNKDYWGLSPEGRTRLDELLFSTQAQPEPTPDVADTGASAQTSEDDEPDPGGGQAD